MQVAQPPQPEQQDRIRRALDGKGDYEVDVLLTPLTADNAAPPPVTHCPGVCLMCEDGDGSNVYAAVRRWLLNSSAPKAVVSRYTRNVTLLLCYPALAAFSPSLRQKVAYLEKNHGVTHLDAADLGIFGPTTHTPGESSGSGSGSAVGGDKAVPLKATHPSPLEAALPGPATPAPADGTLVPEETGPTASTAPTAPTPAAAPTLLLTEAASITPEPVQPPPAMAVTGVVAEEPPLKKAKLPGPVQAPSAHQQEQPQNPHADEEETAGPPLSEPQKTMPPSEAPSASAASDAYVAVMHELVTPPAAAGTSTGVEAKGAVGPSQAVSPLGLMHR